MPMQKPQGFAPFTDGFYDCATQVRDWTRRIALSCFAAAAEAKASITTPADVRERQAAQRSAFLESIGGMPDAQADLDVRECGTLMRPTHSITKLVFQSVPGAPVAALLYRPEPVPEGPTAAVLMLCGHSKPGKAAPAYQRVCTALARAGMVVLIVEAPSQGEMVQCLTPGGEPAAGINTREHSHLQAPYWLLNRNIARFFTANAVRGLDLLSSLPEVDPARIGVTGNSGGGTQTQYLLMVDDRPAAAMPCCSVSTRESYLATGSRAFDGEQNLWDAIRRGPDFDDFLAAAAPRPVCVGAAEYDFFCLEGVLQSRDRAVRAYEALGAADRCGLCLAEGELHGYSAPLRQGCVAWMSRHLLGREPERQYADEELPVEEVSALVCTETGNVLTAVPGARSMAALIRDEWCALRQVARPVSVDELREWLALPAADGPVRARRTRSAEEGGVVAEHWFFFAEPDVALTAVLYRPANRAPRRASVLLLPDGTAGQQPFWTRIRERLAAGDAVYVPDLRGLGAVRMLQSTAHGQESRAACDLFMLGTSLAAWRSWDLLRHLAFLRSARALPGLGDIALEAFGGVAVYGLLAAAIDGGFAACRFEDCLATWDDVFGGGPLDESLFGPPFVAPELRGRVDISDLARLIGRDGACPVTFARTRGADGTPVSASSE